VGSKERAANERETGLIIIEMAAVAALLSTLLGVRQT
jgi:hypothetical protein